MRTAASLLVSALVMALGSGCALDHAADASAVADEAPGLAPSDEELGGEVGKWQVPPVKWRIVLGGGDVLFSTVALRTEAGAYHANTEYWFAGDTALPSYQQLGVPSLELDAYPLDAETESSINAWTSPLTVAFSCPRIVADTDWHEGVVPIASGLKPHLYWMPSPDDVPDLILGLLLVTNADGRLVSTAWYRSSAPDLSGRAFKSTSWSAPLTPVFDRDGAVTADPSYIQEADWHYIEMSQQ